MAGELQIKSCLADDAGDRRHAEAFGFKHWALFNMNFEEADGLLIGNRIFELASPEAETFNCFADACANRVFERKYRRIKASGSRTAANKRKAKTHSLFFR